ncbi:MAG: 2-oxo acid dehydrogenase subunit E2 [Acidimicrobiaceae bacterium]|nr:2-oxo acid dehydrogenase subunit E2 [Acidimicrobiaceae bacterium]
MAEITMPQLGETVTEGTITRWFKQVGDEVALDEALFEVSTDKVDTEVPSPVAGVVAEILAGEGDLVEVGQVLARVGEAGEAPPAEALAVEPVQEVVEPPAVAPVQEVVDPPAAPEPPPAPEPTPEAVEAPSEPAEPEIASEPEEPRAAGAFRAAGIVLSPVVRRLISENNLDPSTLTGTGLGGRITRADVEQAIRTRASAEAEAPTAAESPAAAEAPAPVEAEPPPPAAAPEEPRRSRRARRSAVPAVAVRTGDSVVPLNNIRRRTAEHMVMSKQTSPHVLTAIEVDYEGVETVRRSAKQAWKAEEGFSLTYLPFIARAVVDALRDYPHLNASFGGDELVVHANVNLAVAVDIDFQGLLAPVIHGAEGKRLRQIARDIVDLANRARSRKLGPDDLAGGTFTLTNAGQYGTMMQFPIINQPQVAILSTDGVARKPVVVTDSYGNESIAIHSMGVLAMAWDHRAFDGAYAAAFLHRIKEIIETRDWEAEIR